jgi:glycerate 2-kinase
VTIVVCPDKFRGTLTAWVAADAIAQGLRLGGCTGVIARPLADGGEGTAEVLRRAVGGEVHAIQTVDALGNPLSSSWVELADGSAVVESAASIGTAVLQSRPDPMAASTKGVGRVIAEVIARGPRRLYVAVGGTATTDGGIGCLRELRSGLRGVPTVVLCDVRTEFLSAAELFARQKGATDDEVARLTVRLHRVAAAFAKRGFDVARIPYAGAGGGLAGGLAVLGAELDSGFEVVARLSALESLLRRADAVITGEGRLDATSLEGKVVDRVLRATERPSVRFRAVVAGSAEPLIAASLQQRGVRIVTLVELAGGSDEAFSAAERLAMAAGRSLARSSEELAAGRYR